jgi:hypothetical protein
MTKGIFNPPPTRVTEAGSLSVLSSFLCQLVSSNITLGFSNQVTLNPRRAQRRAYRTGALGNVFCFGFGFGFSVAGKQAVRPQPGNGKLAAQIPCLGDSIQMLVTQTSPGHT